MPTNDIFSPGVGSVDWSVAGNWSPAAVPVGGDTTFLQNIGTDITAGLAQSGVTLAAFNQYQNFTGKVGSASSYLFIGATVFNLGIAAPGGGSGSPRMNIKAANSGAIFNIRGSNPTASDTGFAPVRILGTALVVSATGGVFCCALAAGETATIATLTMINGGTAPTGTLGAGCTLTTGNVYDGTLNNYSAAASTVTVAQNGTLNHYGTGGYTALTVDKDCTCNYAGSGTITTLNVTGTLDLSQGTDPITVTNCNLYPGAVIIDPAGRLVFTNPFRLVECTLGDVTLNFGWNRTYQVA